jgi:hypothetical protein
MAGLKKCMKKAALFLRMRSGFMWMGSSKVGWARFLCPPYKKWVSASAKE